MPWEGFVCQNVQGCNLINKERRGMKTDERRMVEKGKEGAQSELEDKYRKHYIEENTV